MIIYDPFWKTLKLKGETTYSLIHKYKVSSGTLDQMRKGKNLTTLTINDFCRILKCNVEDIMKYIPDEEKTDE